MAAHWWAQILAVMRLELKKNFFSRRGLWVYLLAGAPILLYAGHSIVELQRGQNDTPAPAGNSRILTSQDMEAIEMGMSREDLLKKLGEPASKMVIERESGVRETYRYVTEGDGTARIGLRDGEVVSISTGHSCTIASDNRIFAGVFQFFYLRLAIFFGCVGIFMNLFRGEMIDKSLHYYFLAPIRREVLLAGKFLSGLVAATIVFTSSTMLQLIAMSWHFSSASIQQYLFQAHGLAHVAAYLGVTALACLGYGSVFLAAGVLFRNPLIPAAIVLVWEAASTFLPPLLQKVSVIYYLRGLCPVDVPVRAEDFPPLALLTFNPDPVAAPVAVLGLLVLSIAVLAIAGLRVRRMEINYGTE